MNSFKQEMKNESNEQLRSSNDWRAITDKDIAGIRDILKGKIFAQTQDVCKWSWRSNCILRY